MLLVQAGPWKYSRWPRPLLLVATVTVRRHNLTKPGWETSGLWSGIKVDGLFALTQFYRWNSGNWSIILPLWFPFSYVLNQVGTFWSSGWSEITLRRGWWHVTPTNIQSLMSCTQVGFMWCWWQFNDGVFWRLPLLKTYLRKPNTCSNVVSLPSVHPLLSKRCNNNVFWGVFLFKRLSHNLWPQTSYCQFWL